MVKKITKTFDLDQKAEKKITYEFSYAKHSIVIDMHIIVSAKKFGNVSALAKKLLKEETIKALGDKISD